MKKLLAAVSLVSFLAACAWPDVVSERDYPLDCKREQKVKELLRRGDVHRGEMLREKPPENMDAKAWLKVREIRGKRARECYQMVLDTKSDHAYALLALGFTHLVQSTFPDTLPEEQEKSLSTAATFIQKAFEVRRLDAQAYYYLGEIAARRGQCEKAIKIFNSLLASNWVYSHVYTWLGYCYELTKQPKEAQESYKRAADVYNPVEIGEWAKTKIKR